MGSSPSQVKPKNVRQKVTTDIFRQIGQKVAGQKVIICYLKTIFELHVFKVQFDPTLLDKKSPL